MAEGETYRLAIGAEFGIVQAAQLQGEWLQALQEQAAEPQPWALDVSAVQEFDSAGLQMLLALRRSLAESGQSLSLEAPSSVLEAALRSFGLSAALDPLQLEVPA